MTTDVNGSITNTVKQFGKKLFGFIRGKVSNNEDAEDILQDVWYQFSTLTNVSDIENVSAWLYQVARNKVVDKYRKKKNSNFDYNEEGELKIKEILLIDDSSSPELGLFKEAFWEQLMESLDELPENQREVFVLNEIEDMTLQEIADLKNENLKTIISRKGYAVKYLRRKLDYLYQELND